MKILFSVLLFFPISLFAQKFSHADSLRGNLNLPRTCFDVKHYELNIQIDPEKKYLKGKNTISFTCLKTSQEIQIDLFANLQVNEISMQGKPLTFKRDGNAIFIHFQNALQINKKYSITIKYEGQPRKAVRPPWDGGFSWTKDPSGNPWVTVSCEGLGASVWWPCKDHPSDEPETMDINIEGPKNLMTVSNGNLISKKSGPFTDTYHWHISYPINTYNVSINMANYAHWSKTFKQLNGKTLPLDYYVLKENESIAKKHFKQSEEMLLIFEKYFGPYPFQKDGYALVETDYWGMEHQSAVAYGNHYINNRFGFDFIIVHESAHEWFGNSISCQDHADLWIHEALGTYAEAIYVEEKSGKVQAQTYLNGQKNNIRYTFPIAGPYGVNYQHPDSDMYFKGTWMMHTLRSIVHNDVLWFKTLKDFCQSFYHKNTNTQEVVEFFSSRLKGSTKEIMMTYLYEIAIPKIQYSIQQKEGKWMMKYRWANVSDNIKFPIRFESGQEIIPNTNFQEITFHQEPSFDLNHYLIQTEKLN